MKKDKIQIGLIGLGTIGTGVAKILIDNQENLGKRAGIPIVLKKAADLILDIDRGVTFTPGQLTNDAMDIINDPEIDIVVEVIGGVNPAKKFIDAALDNKKHVVTSNKEIIAKHGPEFIETARKNGVNIYYEAAVAGGIPIIHALKNCLAANNIQKVFGIMNGTTNFILTHMTQNGAEFDDVLKEAQRLGYAEADPTNDVDGFDVAYKLSILASIAFNAPFSYQDIHFEGIRNITKSATSVATELGYVIKLLAIGIEHDHGEVELRVHPVMIDRDHPLAHVNGSFNAVFVKGNYVDETMFYGPGAGELPTASAVVGDIMDIAMNPDAKGSHPSIKTDFSQKRIRPMGEVESEYFIQMTVEDHAGVLAGVTRVLGDYEVSILSVDQKLKGSEKAEIDMVTHLVKEADMQAALLEIKALEAVISVDSIIRVGI